MKVAILGLSPTTHMLGMVRLEGWEMWGLPWDEEAWPYLTRAFEMHDMRLLESAHCRRRPGYFDRLQEMPCLYMQESYWPTVERYPFEAVAESVGQAYWNSSIAYAMALAIHEGASEIGVYGVDMKGDDEFGYQKPNMEYLVGVARGKGIKVSIPDASPLCKFQQGAKFYNHTPEYVGRYGWLG